MLDWRSLFKQRGSEYHGIIDGIQGTVEIQVAVRYPSRSANGV